MRNNTGLPNRARGARSRGLPEADLPKHRQVFESLLYAIQSGVYTPGDRLPSEAELGKTFLASRITVAKAVNELQRLGLVSRRAGAGTYVVPSKQNSGRVFGLLIPDLGRTEIFEPICHGMLRSPLAAVHSLLWGHAMGESKKQEEEAEHLCHHYIAQKVSGVFFAPLEFTPHKDVFNRRIAGALDRAGIPIVLLDRCIAAYPERSRYDLVGIDNRRAGFQITRHLLQLGAKRIAFVAKPLSAPTVEARIAGYREALYSAGLCISENLVRFGDPEDRSFIRSVMDDCRPDAIVCANDLTAAKLMHGLLEIGIRIPEEVRMVGLDDVRYASMLPVPLTTHHQNCGDIGAVAMSAMLERIEHSNLPTRDILLQTRLVVRKSCGASLPLGN
ncbi:MAG: GntR family transcriptional regulator [Silvibacterium sp.]|nr:GntR family transcriptional regulator [Silvibacterium sp.]MBV8438645.1 GntR family transcriptional regulator [Silvibacterium sp.]